MHLFRDRRFALLFVGQAVNGIGSWCALIALWGFAAYKFDTGGTGVALLALCWSAPAALLGPFIGVPIDRLGPRRVLLWSYLAGAGAAVGMGFARSLRELAMVAVLYGVTRAFAHPAADSLPPRIVAGKDLLAANALLGAAQESAIVFGPLVAAGAIAVAGLQAAFFVDAATYLVGAAVVFPLVLSPVEGAPERVPLREELAVGLRLTRDTPILRFVMSMSAACFLTWGAFVVVEPLYARDVLDQPASTFAMFQVVFGVGLVLTGLVLPRLGERAAGPRPLAASVLLSGLTAGLYVGTESVWVACVGVFLWGVDVAFFAAPSRTLLQRGSPVHAHGRVLGLYRAAHSVADVIALPLTGLLVSTIGVQAAGLAVAGVALTVGTIGWLRAPSPLPADPDPEPEPEPGVEPVALAV